MNIPGDMAANLAADSKALDSLRVQAKHSPDQALKAAAQQFESVFLSMMLKSMRDATPQDGMFDNEQTKMFTSMLDQQLAQNISSKGMGLADMMVKQLSRQNGIDPKQLTQSAALPQGSVAQAGSPTKLVKPDTAVTQPKATPTAIPSAYSESFQRDFVQRMMPHAAQASQSTGIPAHLMVGQAALESGWGKREIRNADGTNSHNLFGIKAGNNWKGKVAEVATTEYKNGVAYKQVEKFRSYSSFAEAFQDYASLIRGNSRYTNVMQYGNNAYGFAQALQQAGYATDPKYADKLIGVIGKVSALA